MASRGGESKISATVQGMVNSRASSSGFNNGCASSVLGSMLIWFKNNGWPFINASCCCHFCTGTTNPEVQVRSESNKTIQAFAMVNAFEPHMLVAAQEKQTLFPACLALCFFLSAIAQHQLAQLLALSIFATKACKTKQLRTNGVS
jgi:hypothetical protein